MGNRIKININILQKLEEELFSIGKIRFLKYITPVNLKEQKDKFLKSKIQDPEFTYREPEFDTKTTEQELTEVIEKIPRNDLGNLLVEKGNELSSFNKVIQNIGNREVVTQLSTELYGIPDSDLVDKAKEVLKNLPKEDETDKNFNAEEVAKIFKDRLVELGLVDWTVEVREQASVSISSLKRKIFIASLKKYSEKDIKRLLVHEVDVHALRAENGHKQPLKIFARGLAGFLPTGDGIALYFEKKQGVMDVQREKEIALRVIAVDLVYQGKSFKEVFDEINTYEKAKEKCWEITYRVFRGGGILKDHLYLQGYLDIVKFIEKEDQLKDLYVGRIGIKHLTIANKLIKEGILKRPTYTPEYI